MLRRNTNPAATQRNNNVGTIRPTRPSTTRMINSTAARQPFDASDMPSATEMLDFLALLHAAASGRTPIPDEDPIMPPRLPRRALEGRLTDPATIGLTPEDMNPTKQVRYGSLQRVLTAIQINHYRAAGLPAPMQYRVHQFMTKIASDIPELPRGTLYCVSPATEPMKIVKDHPNNWQVVTDKANNPGIPVIPALDHSNECRCMALYANNNYETLQPLRACLPVELYHEYGCDQQRPSASEMTYAPEVMKNVSDVYASEVSSAGTVLMRQIRRAPVAQVYRSNPVFKRPQYSLIDLTKSKILYNAVAAQTQRGDVNQFTEKFNHGPRITNSPDLTRFRTLGPLKNDIDVGSYGPEIQSIEDIMINEPLVDAFYGQQTCMFCDLVMFITTPSAVLHHYIKRHKALIDAYFTCPGCIIPNVVHTSEYFAHYDKYHSKALGLMFVLNETNVHVRAQHAHVLYMFLMTAIRLEYQEKQKWGTRYASAIGGWAREDNPPTLEAEIMELQAKAAPTPGPAPAGNEPEPEYIRQFKGLYRPDPNAQDSECGKPQPYIRARNDDGYGNQPTNYREREANRSTAGYNGTLLEYSVMEDDDFLHVSPRDTPVSPPTARRGVPKYSWPQAAPQKPSWFEAAMEKSCGYQTAQESEDSQDEPSKREDQAKEDKSTSTNN